MKTQDNNKNKTILRSKRRADVRVVSHGQTYVMVAEMLVLMVMMKAVVVMVAVVIAVTVVIVVVEEDIFL